MSESGWLSMVIFTLTGSQPCHRVTWLISPGWAVAAGITFFLIGLFIFTNKGILSITVQEILSLLSSTLYSTSYLPFLLMFFNWPLSDTLFNCVVMVKVRLLWRPFSHQTLFKVSNTLTSYVCALINALFFLLQYVWCCFAQPVAVCYSLLSLGAACFSLCDSSSVSFSSSLEFAVKESSSTY